MALGKGRFLDCHETVAIGQCRASKSNSARNLVSKYGTSAAISNCRLVSANGECWLILTKTVKAGDELLWLYGNRFNMDGSVGEPDNEESDPDTVSQVTEKKKRKRGSNNHW